MPQHSHYRIDLPRKTYSSKPTAVVVTPSSPKSNRNHVERFARYLLREMHYGGIQFEAVEQPTSIGYVPYRAYLFSAEDRYVGAACFRFKPDHCPQTPWLFDWVWLHPYFRRQGHLAALWPDLTPQFGQFRLSEPISPAMQNFLLKHGHKAV